MNAQRTETVVALAGAAVASQAVVGLVLWENGVGVKAAVELLGRDALLIPRALGYLIPVGLLTAVWALALAGLRGRPPLGAVREPRLLPREARRAIPDFQL